MLNVMLAFLFCSYWLGHKPPMVLLFLLVAPYALRNPRDFRESRQLGTIPGTDEDIKDRNMLLFCVPLGVALVVLSRCVTAKGILYGPLVSMGTVLLVQVLLFSDAGSISSQPRAYILRQFPSLGRWQRSSLFLFAAFIFPLYHPLLVPVFVGRPLCILARSLLRRFHRRSSSPSLELAFLVELASALAAFETAEDKARRALDRAASQGGWSSSADTAAVFGLHSTASTFLDLLRLLPPDHLVALRRHFDIGLEDVTYRHPDGNLLFHLWQRVPLMHEIDISLGRHANEAFRAAGLLHPPHLSPLSPSQRAHDPHYPPYAYFTMLSDVAAALQRRLLLPFAFSFPGIQQDQQDDILSSWPTFACRCLGTILSPSPSVSQPIPSHLEGYIPALARPCLTQYHAFLADARRNLTNHQDAASLFAKTCDVLRGEEDREKVQEMLEVAVLDAVLAWQEARRDRRKAKME